MKTTFKIVIAALAAITAFASCQKENVTNNGNSTPATEGTRVLTLSFDSGTKATLDGLQPKFQDGEYVRISNGTAYEDKQISVVGEVATITTSLTGTLTAVIPRTAAKMDGNQIDGVIIPASQSGAVENALICMATGAADATSLHFTGQTSLFIVTPPAGVKQFVVQSSASAINSEASPADKSITVGDGSSDLGTYYVSLLPGAGLNDLTFVAGSLQKKINSTNATAANTAYTITNAWYLSGLFSVSATKKVHFSKGNLWADGSNALHFESNQYSSASSWDASHVSHFTWSSTVEAAVGYPNSGDNLFCDESHKVSVDESDAIYYALSKDEWTYLFNNHTKKWASVNGVNGYVIAPDGFAGTLSDTYANDAALATAGNLVFLPAVGNRLGSNVGNVGDFGQYWSSSADGWDGAYCVYFRSSSVEPDYGDDRDYGFSVRLITDVE